MTEEQIKQKYPFFENCDGFDVSEHWLPVVERLSMLLYYNHKRHGSESPQVLRVKSKLGGLRYYLSHYHPTYEKYIQIAEKTCRGICEKCGSKENVETININHWLWTVCGGCAKNKHIK